MKDNECVLPDGIVFGNMSANRDMPLPSPSVWSRGELMDIAKLFDGMYTCMWEYTHRVVCFLTIHEKDGLYNSTKVKALLRFISEIKKLGYEFSFDNTVGMMIERIGAADLQAGNIDWKTTLERAAESGTLPPMMTFYIGKVSHG